MATLMAVYVHDRCLGRCDAKCYDGLTDPDNCVCICHGDNHGVGLDQAIENTRAYAWKWQKDWRKEHLSLVPYAEFKTYNYQVVTQTSFFPDMAYSTAVAV